MSGVQAMLCDTHRHSHRAADIMGRADHARRERSSRSLTSRVRRAAAGVATSVPGFLLRLPRAASLLAPLALLLAALAFAQPAAAQTSVTLVQNDGQSFTDSHAGTFNRGYATSFTTGGAREGYTLTGLDLYLKSTTTSDVSVLNVQIYADNGGLPDTTTRSLVIMTDPDGRFTSSFAPYRFTDALKLAANTTYWVTVVSGGSDIASHSISGTSSDNEDSGGLSGWSIGNNRLWKSPGSPLWSKSQTNANALRMNLVGYGNDTTAPVLRNARVSSDGTELTLYYDEELDPNSAPAHARFSTNIGGEGQALPRDGAAAQRNAAVTVSGSTVTMDLVVDSANAVTSSQAVAMGYNAAAATSPLRNLAGLKAARVSGLAVTNDRDETVPTVTGVAISSPPTHDTDTPADGTLDTYGVGAKISVRLTYDERVTVDTSRGRPRLKIKMHNDFGEKWAVYDTSVGSSLFFDYTVVSGNTSSNGTTDAGIRVLANSLELTGGSIRSAATERDASLAHAGGGPYADHKVNGALDGQPPRFESAQIAHDNTDLSVIFDEAPDSTSAPRASSFCVTATAPGGSARLVCGSDSSDVTFTTTLGNHFVKATLTEAIRSDEVLTVSYTKPTSNFLKDANGQAVESFSGMPVINTILPPGNPTDLAVTAGTQSGSLSVTWTAPTSAARGKSRGKRSRSE